MQYHGYVFSRFHRFVGIADRTLADRAGEGAVYPDGFATLQEVAPDQVGRGKVIVATRAARWQ